MQHRRTMTVYTYLRSIIIAFGLLLCGAILPFLNATPLLIGKVPSSDDHQQGSTNSIFPHLLLTKTIKDSFKLPSLSKIVGSSCKLPYDAEELNTRLKSDPDTKLNASGLISSKGYPVEDHEVQTKDGFILGLQRIPHGISNKHTIQGKRPAVLLQHGLLCSSTNWVSNLANESLGFILADAGYDVWLGNVRGNTYSLKHAYLKPDSREFWHWSLDEMAKYDLPAMINYILNVTSEAQLFYVGHSQGTTIAFAAFSQDQELGKKVKTFFALAPVTQAHHTTSIVRGVFDTGMYVELVRGMDLLGQYQFLPQNSIFDYFSSAMCGHESTVIVCKSVLFLVAGYNCQHMNASRIPVYISNTPAGTSIWDLQHWGQSIVSGNFTMFDYGSRGNMKHYSQETPPPYNVEDMQVPTAFFSGDSDILATPTDVRQLIPKIQNLVYNKEIPTYGHLDFTWAIDAADFVYSDIVKLMSKTGQH